MKMKGYLVKLAPLVMGAVLAGCDIGPDGLNTAFDSAEEAYSSSSSSGSGARTVTISGVAAKGLISGGVVNIHPIVNGVLSNTPVGESVSTNSAGNYSVTINQYDGNPFVVRVTSTDSTTMKCDLAAGCGAGFAFGSFVPLTDVNFSLDAVVPPIPTQSSSTGVNLSVLTHTAAQVALNDLSSLTDTSLSSVTAAVSRANSSVANRFGVIGNLTSLPVVDLTSPAALVNVQRSVLEYNLLNVGVVEALLGGDNTASIASSVGQFSTQYVTQGGLADRELTNTTSVTLAEILSRASSVIDAISATDTDNILNLSQLSSTIEANQQLAENGSTTPTEGEADPQFDSELAMVKAMVGEVRKVGTAINDGFESEQSIIDAIVDTDLESHMQGLSVAAKAIGNAHDAYEMDSQLTAYEDAETGVMVSIAADETTVTYAVDSSIEVSTGATVLVGLNAIDTGSSIEETAGENTTTTMADVELAITGSAATATATMMINSGSMLKLSNIEVISNDGEVPTTGMEGTDIQLLLDATVSETASNLDASFAGTIDFMAEGLVFNDTSAANEVMTVHTATLSLGGTFSAANGDSILASANVISEASDFNFLTEEMDDSFADASYTVTLSLTTLTNIAPKVTVTLTGERASAMSDDVTIRISYGAIVLTSSTTTGEDSSQLVITDKNNVILTVNEDAQGVVSGNVTYNETEYATIDESSGFLAVSYSDGVNETLW